MLDSIPAAPAGDFYAPAEAPAIVRHRPEFSGRAGEYFGIWFVNLLLSIITLGIYSAWAKVRTERYFYANTRLAGSTFEYLASPLAILKGRLIAYAIVIALSLSAQFALGLYAFLAFLVAMLMPWVIVMSLRFRARNSGWRGLTFRFDQTGASAYGPFMGWPILSALSLSLLYPVMKRRQHAFVVDGHWFGRKRFNFDATLGAYYAPYGVAIGLGLFLLIGMGFGVGGVVMATGGQSSSVPLAVYAVMVAFYLGFFALMAMLQVRYTNLFWNSTRLGTHRFESTLRVRDMIWLYASNLVAIVCTLGLAVPWAMIRLARYRADHFTVVASGSIEDFIADADSQYGAGGAELIDALDVGADFGF